jgi:cytochrome c5
MAGRSISPLRRIAASVRGKPALVAAAVLLASPLGATPGTAPATPAASSEVVTRSIEQRPPARPLSEAGRVDERSLSAEQLEDLARASRERWERSSHGAMLLRILPDRLRPSQLPRADSRGARLVALYCVQCHNLPDPAMHDANRWPEVVRRMVPRMQGRGNLGPLMADLMRAPGAGERAMSAPSADEEREIVAYLQRYAQRSLDPKADPALAQALGSGAGRMFAEACSQCHALPDPSQHTPEEWPKVVARMRENLDWMNRVQGGADPREPQLSVPEIVGFLQEHARRPAR